MRNVRVSKNKAFKMNLSLISRRLITSTALSTNVPSSYRVGLPNPVMSTDELQRIIDEKLAKYPYFVERTKFGKGLPVYSDYKHQRARKLTIIRRVYGDMDAFRRDLQAEFPNVKIVKCPVDQQKLVLKGHLVQEVKLFLTDLGF